MDETSKAFSEVYDIINCMQENLYNKIPKGFIKIVNQNRDTNYKTNIDFSKNINEQNLLRETRVILSLIYRDYICDIETRKKLLLKDKEKQEEKERLFKERYEINFEKRREGRYNIDQTENDTQLIEVKEKSIIKRIIDKILNIFRKNKIIN